MDKQTLERKSFEAAAHTAALWTRITHTDTAKRVTRGIRQFLLGLVLSQGMFFGSYAPLGIAFTGACTTKGIYALLGSVLGYIFGHGGMLGLSCAVASILTFICAYIFKEHIKKAWFMPLSCSFMTLICTFILLPAPPFLSIAQIFQFITVCVITGGLCWCYIKAFSYPKRLGDFKKPVGLLAIIASVLISLGEFTLFGTISPSRVLAYILTLSAAYLVSSTSGATFGVIFGVTMDITSGSGAFFTCVYSLSALLAGAFRSMGKLPFLFSAAITASAACLLGIDNPLFTSGVYECCLSAFIFWFIPDALFQYVKEALIPSPENTLDKLLRMKHSAGKYASEASDAFYEMYLAMMSGAQTGRATADEDVHAIFDCAADSVCRTCRICNQCWQKEYVSTLSALNDVSVPMLKRGRAEASDFPKHFSERCIHFPELLNSINRALFSIRERQQYRKRCEENCTLIAQQYAGLTGILRQISSTLGCEQAELPARERQVRSYASAFGMVDKVAVFRDGKGHLRVELDGEAMENILHQRKGFAAGLSAVLSICLSEPERISDELGTRLILKEQAPFRAIVGIGQRQKQNEHVSGDTARSFVTDSGQACLLLADGMGTGEAAAKDSRMILSLMERFLKAGIPPDDALRTVSPAFKLKCDSTRGVTLDLLMLDLFTGRGSCLKCGAASSYILSGNKITSIAGGNLPVGLSDDIAADQSIPIKLQRGDLFIMVSDGICDSIDDKWLKNLIYEHQKDTPKELAAHLVVAAAKRGTSDDLSALVFRLEQRPLPV